MGVQSVSLWSLLLFQTTHKQSFLVSRMLLSILPLEADPVVDDNRCSMLQVGPSPVGWTHARLFTTVSEIYQVTGPVERFAGQIASQGYVVACPSSYHEFEGPEAIPYDTEGLSHS